ncbi:hypothetical protein [Alteribacter aurantiacus]|uniref:hypothetical protein n=1 Tax=Alteribacter aurantiacus TaxID=254410 RepID=UPI00040F1B6D|nr:hypothetical protein [Alteribacter aurantiacus]
MADLFKRLLEERVVIDPTLYIVKIQDKVGQEYSTYLNGVAERWKHNSTIIEQVEFFKKYDL